MEKFTNSNEVRRESVIEANARLDAPTYIKLMSEKYPESLELDDNGNITMNLIEGLGFMNDRIKSLKLSAEDRLLYLSFLEQAVKEFLKK